MYKITVTKNGIVKSVQYNESAEQGEANARLEFGDDCEYRVEDAAEDSQRDYA